MPPGTYQVVDFNNILDKSVKMFIHCLRELQNQTQKYFTVCEKNFSNTILRLTPHWVSEPTTEKFEKEIKITTINKI